jgi:hypothetical protein
MRFSQSRRNQLANVRARITGPRGCSAEMIRQEYAA